MPSCPRCSGWTFPGQGRERWCVVCGWQSYGPAPLERRRQFLCECGAFFEKNGITGPAPLRCPPCRQTVRMSQKAARLREFRARRRADEALSGVKMART